MKVYVNNRSRKHLNLKKSCNVIVTLTNGKIELLEDVFCIKVPKDLSILDVSYRSGDIVGGVTYDSCLIFSVNVSIL